jgi:hypothetical protein
MLSIYHEGFWLLTIVDNIIRDNSVNVIAKQSYVKDGHSKWLIPIYAIIFQKKNSIHAIAQQ